MITLFSVVVLYAFTLGVGISAAVQHVSGAQIPISVPEFTLVDGGIFLIVFAVMTFVMVRFGRVARLSLGTLLTLAILAGSMFVFSAWVPWPYDLGLALLLLLAIRIRPLVLPHNIGVALGIAGISALLGIALTPLWAVGLLAVLSVYDIISVYRTRHMVALAGRMLDSGAVFGFLVPARWRTFVRPVSGALKDREVMVLGSGDVGLPLVLATSSVATSIPAAVIVAGASLVGLLLMQWLFVHQRRPMPMAALPPIAACAILGYVIAVLLNV